jgi:hypothetical protein
VAAFIITISSSALGVRAIDGVGLCQLSRAAWNSIESRIAQRKKYVEAVSDSTGSSGMFAASEVFNVFNARIKQAVAE